MGVEGIFTAVESPCLNISRERGSIQTPQRAPYELADAESSLKSSDPKASINVHLKSF
jgi:hypothetical protein